MKLAHWWDRLSLFWKIYCFCVILIFIIVATVEAVVEPAISMLMEKYLKRQFEVWHEIILWFITISIQALACGYAFTKYFSGRLAKLVKASQSLAKGNFEARLPAKNNNKDEFDLLIQSFNRMSESITGLMRNERRLLADISHELRSPLTRMQIAAALLKREETDPKRFELARRIEIETEHMDQLIGSLLTQGKDRFMESEGPREDVDLSELLATAVDDFNFTNMGKNKKIKADIQSGLTVFGHIAVLNRMLGNVLANAIFYAPTGSAVNVAAKTADDAIEISVRDFGPGVPENLLADVFRPFFRVDSSRSRESGGAGLGLALTKEAALAHGGTIVASNANPGLLITIILPILTEDEKHFPPAGDGTMHS